MNVPFEWRKSSYSGGSSADCVEVAPAVAVVGVRDTKSRNLGHLTVTRDTWTAFVRSLTR